jgi:hypothetical protein
MSTGHGPSYGPPPNEVGDYRRLAIWMGLQSAYEFPFPIDANFFIVQYNDHLTLIRLPNPTACQSGD